MSGFELSKWYADCVTDAGEAAILYQATMRIAGIPIHYESLLTKMRGSEAGAVYSLRRYSEPQVEESEIGWSSRALGAKGRWTERGTGQTETLYASGDGSLEWNCMAPRAAATVDVSDSVRLRGWGYVEHLRLTVVPWRLPIRRLRWGRFVNATDALVWIDWEGPYTKRVVYMNGRIVEASVVEDDRVVLKDGTGELRMEASEVIRDGRLGETALAVIPRLETMFPDSALNIRERKWLSRAVLRCEGREVSAGMAIHEVVEWP